MTNPPVRKIVLWSALAATLLAVIAIDEEPEESRVDTAAEAVLPTRNVDRRTRTSDNRSNQTLPVDQLGKRTFKAEADDIFAVNSWQPPPVNARKKAGGDEEDEDDPFFVARRASKPLPAPTPVAPPLAIKYLGRVSDGRVTRVFLVHQEKNYATKVGERIDGLYRLDSIRDDVLELTYLPLGIKQKLVINEKTSGKT